MRQRIRFRLSAQVGQAKTHGYVLNWTKSRCETSAACCRVNRPAAALYRCRCRGRRFWMWCWGLPSVGSGGTVGVAGLSYSVVPARRRIFRYEPMTSAQNYTYRVERSNKAPSVAYNALRRLGDSETTQGHCNARAAAWRGGFDKTY